MPTRPPGRKLTACLELIGKAGLTGDLNPDEALALARLAEERRYPRRGVILRETARTRDLYVIRSGTVSVRMTLPASSSSEAIYTLRDGQAFGELSLVDGAPRSATIQAEDAVTVYRFDFDRLSEFLDAHPRIGYILMRNLAGIIASRVRSTNLMWRNTMMW